MRPNALHIAWFWSPLPSAPQSSYRVLEFCPVVAYVAPLEGRWYSYVACPPPERPEVQLIAPGIPYVDPRRRGA